jgi:LacI family transcriptional regulator
MLKNHCTIYDIAREAKVSAKTVSRVINDKGGVGANTRARVLEIIERVGFHPHIGARALRGRQNACIGVILPAPSEIVPISQTFFIWLFAELYRIFGRHGEYINYDMNPYVLGSQTNYGRGVFENLYKACVVSGPLAINDPIIPRIHATGIPYVTLSRLDSLPECSCAVVDYEEGAYISTKFLIDRGHRRIAMLKAFEGYQAGVERVRGYTRALEEAGLSFDENLIRSVSFGATNVANMVHRLLVDDSVTALIDCSATEDACSLREGMRRAGRTIGKDVDVVAWTYSENAPVLNDACAHVWLPLIEAATEGLEQLAEWTRGTRTEPIHIVFRPVMFTSWSNAELSKPKRLFDVRE